MRFLNQEKPGDFMKIFLDLFLVFSVNIFVSCAISLNENENIAFFTERIVFHPAKSPATADIHGKFISDARLVSVAEFYDVSLLQECVDLNHGLIEFSQDMQKRKKRNQKFGKKLRSSFKDIKDREKLKNTLTHFQCVHALKNVDFEEIGLELIVKLTKEFPEVMKLHLDLFGYLEDYSFLTLDIVKVLYMDRSPFLRPFGLDELIKTVSKEVLIKLLEMWNFDLRAEDANHVVLVRGEDLVELLEIDPRAWLLWRKAGIFKPFPLDLLIEKLTIETFNIYINLILAFVYDREEAVFSSMYSLEYQYADIHRNDPLQEMYMNDEMISALESRKWDIWHERGKSYIEIIENLMKMSKKLIAKLKELIEVLKNDDNSSTAANIALYDVLVLLQVPLNHHARSTFVKSRDIDQVIEAEKTYVYHRFGEYTPFVLSVNMMNPVYWQILWIQFDIWGIESAYDAFVSESFLITRDLMITISTLSRFAHKAEGSKYLPNYHWHIYLYTLLLSTETQSLEVSQTFMKALIGFMKDQICELNPLQLSFMKRFLHQSIVEDDMDILETRDILIEMYRLAPEMLSRDEIAELIQTPELKKLMKYSIGNVNKLRLLDSFSAQDLSKHFPIGLNYHLDSCEALYTVNPEALKDYLICCQGAVNYPDSLIWWVHSRSWENSVLVDTIAESIPFSVIFKHPKDADDLNLVFILTNIVGRIKRNPDQIPQKLILKWLIHMEWIFIQFYNEFFYDSSKTKFISTSYDLIIGAEKVARAKLITWLKENEAIEDSQILLELVEKSPLSCIRASVGYELLLSDSVFKLNKGPQAPHFRDIYPQFTVFTSDTPVFKLREADLETAVKQSVKKCESLVEKYFDVVEKQLWLNRLKIANFPKISKYLLNPIPANFSEKLFRNFGSPVHDIFTFFSMLLRSGYATSAVRQMHEDGFLKPDPKGIEASNGYIGIREEIVKNARKDLLDHEMKNLKKSLL